MLADGVSDEVYAEASREFSEKELAYLTSAIASINVWNRFGAALSLDAAGAAEGCGYGRIVNSVRGLTCAEQDRISCRFDESQKVISGACRVLALLCYGSHDETRFAMTSNSWISRLGAPLIALVLTIVPTGSPVQATEDAPKVSVVSLAFSAIRACLEARRLAQARVVAGRFGSRPS